MNRVQFERRDVTRQTDLRKGYSGQRTDQASRLKEFVRENARLKNLLAESMLDNTDLKEAASGPLAINRPL